MSRRHTSTLRATLKRTLVGSLVVMLVAAALLPVAAVAQSGTAIRPSQIQHEWQLLRQRGSGGSPEDVPAGVGATMLLRSGAVFGEGACSTYDARYEQAADLLNVFVGPQQIAWRECDEKAREFDEQFYDNLAEVSSIESADDVLVVNDVIGEELMVFTRAQIDNDPTLSRWTLARIADADGASQPVIRGLFPWMEFLVGGSLVGNTGCGSFLGKYRLNEGRVDITDVDYRLEACADGPRAQAERMLATLDEITDFQVRPAGLALQDENGIIRLALEPELDVGARTWTPTEVYSRNGKLLHEGRELTTSAIQFLGGDYQGRSICRFFEGDALRSGLAISVERPTFVMKKNQTAKKLCRGRTADGNPLDAVEGAFVEAYEDAASLALRGEELTLTDVNGTLRAVLSPQPPLTGTTWEVFRLYNGKRLAAPDTDAPITAAFEDIDATTIGIVQGDTGVANATDENVYFGTYRTPSATRITVSVNEVQGKGCQGQRNKKSPACKSEARFFKLLEQANGYIVRDGELWFTRDRRTIITLRPQLLGESE